MPVNRRDWITEEKIQTPPHFVTFTAGPIYPIKINESGLSKEYQDRLKEAKDALYRWLMEREEQKQIDRRFGFSVDVPSIGDNCLVVLDGNIYWCQRTSENYYQSGNLSIPCDSENIRVLAIKEYI